MADTPTAFPRFADWVADFCARSTHPFVRDASAMVLSLFELEEQMPQRYGWRYRDEDALDVQIAAAQPSSDLNKVYWLDQARNVEAYALMSVWRGSELLKPAMRSLNVHEVIAPAVLARSLLELATTFVLNATLIERILLDLAFPDGAVAVSQEFEESVVRMIWGTRLGEPASHVKQVNVLTAVQRLSKDPKATELLPTYEYLCEVAHPNVMGNARFWANVEETFDDGSKRIILSRYSDQGTAADIVESLIWSLAWLAVCIRNAFVTTRSSLAILFGKLGVAPSTKRGE